MVGNEGKEKTWDTILESWTLSPINLKNPKPSTAGRAQGMDKNMETTMHHVTEFGVLGTMK